MISVTKLLFAREYYGDSLRYTKNAHAMRNGAGEGMGPVVVWNSTKTCNLKCRHCYMSSDSKKYQDELTTAEAKAFIDDLADFHVPVLLFSGGEPLIRPDFFELAEYAKQRRARVIVKGLRAVSDFEAEVQMSVINRKLNPNVDTMFLPSHEKYTYLSSTVVKEMVRYGVELSDFLPREIIQDVKKKTEESRRDG